jgi:hypothetical protein
MAALLPLPSITWVISVRSHALLANLFYVHRKAQRSARVLCATAKMSVDAGDLTFSEKKAKTVLFIDPHQGWP